MTDVPVRRQFDKALSLATLLLLLSACAASPAASGGPQGIAATSQSSQRAPGASAAAPSTADAGKASAEGHLIATLQPKDQAPLETDGAADETVTMSFTGLASWYGKRFHGLRTASGERYDMTAFTAAHPSLPFGSRVRVTNLANDRSVVVIINDRGPFVKTRLIDVSHAAAKQLGILADGVAEVRVDVLADTAS
ncbi:septal ring lytic transglycosylase RlpA family protein [Pelagibius sp. 7325]|uniref:septal ring lytic transglycosylase RlpA family protein n=1 Tax=Pelagibius sp. 7325 TaxID=3131994 RepID=UPI0030EDBFD9